MVRTRDSHVMAIQEHKLTDGEANATRADLRGDRWHAEFGPISPGNTNAAAGVGVIMRVVP